MNARSAIAYLKPDGSELPLEGATLASDGDFPAYSPSWENLSVFYLVDDGEHFSYVQEKDLAAASLAHDELHALAVENLRTIAKERLEVREYDQIFAVSLDGVFEASLLLLDNLWNRALRSTVESGYIAVIPSRDVLAYCDSSSSKGVEQLSQVVDRVWGDGDHLITRRMFIRESDQWRRYDA